MKPDGSTRRTRALSGRSPPHCSRWTFAPGRTCTASVESRSETISRFNGSPISRSGSPAGTADALSRRRRRTTPLMGATTLRTRPSESRRSGRNRASARCSSDPAVATENVAARATSSALRTADSRASTACRVVSPPLSNSRSRARSRRARSSAAIARCSSARARPSADSAADRPASASARVRESSRGGASAWTRATTVRPATTGSPGSNSIRCSRPDTGADTTKRCRMRVSPSSSMVTDIGPRVTVA